MQIINQYTVLEQVTLRSKWQSFNDIKPPKENALERYSMPVMVGNETTGQVAIVAYMWDYDENGWVFATLDNGPDPGDYEVQHVSHWKLWPKCNLVCLD